MFLGATILGMIMKRLFIRPIPYYLFLLNHKMANRAANYKAKNDIERAQAAESYCHDLTRLMLIYQDCRLRPPDPKQLKDVPFGNEYYWLEKGTRS